MPFTPKFVDLVRNSTSVTGTGAVTLGSAVSGFTSLAAAASVGEQFYYCIQGVDKPAEREVGRGTMQANGTVARQAISGTLTNFTTGAKTIAMVAAAEWFARLEDVANNGAGGGAAFDVATRAALAARTLRTGGVELTEAGREGLFTFNTANLAARVAADPRQGIFVAPTSDPSGASGAWVRRVEGAYNVMWFGAKADFVTDDLPAFQAALAAIRDRNFGAFAGSNRLTVPAGFYYLSGSLNFHSAVSLQGAGSAQPYGAATIIRFGKNVDGFIINHSNTHGNGVGTQGDGSGTMIEGLQLWGGNVNVDGAGAVTDYSAGDSIGGHGVRIRGAFVACKDVASYFFGGDGFNIVASAGSGGVIEGNANSFYLERCQSQYNRGNGYFVGGNDANAGKVLLCSAISCGGGGFLDYSFLGNSYDACHVRDCGVQDPTQSNGPTGTCAYGGLYYYMVAGQQALARTTVPGTNAAVWAPFAGHPYCKPWVTGIDWVNGSPYGTNPGNVNARNVFLGCYAESAQPPVQADYPSLFLGGLLDEVGFSATSTTGPVGSGFNALSAAAFRTIAKSGKYSWIGPAGGISNGAPEILGHSDGTSVWRLYSTNGGLQMDGGGGYAFAIDAPTATRPLGFRTRFLHVSPTTGDINAAMLVMSGTAAPTSGTWPVGAKVINTNAASGPLMWECTAGGSPGTWVAISVAGGSPAAPVVSSQSGTAYTAALGDAGAYVRFTNGAATGFTVPPNSAVAFPVGTVIEVEQAGAGALSVVAGAGVTINSRGGDLTLAGQSGGAALKKVAADSWTLTGDL
jgi:hypothetical protein